MVNAPEQKVEWSYFEEDEEDDCRIFLENVLFLALNVRFTKANQTMKHEAWWNLKNSDFILKKTWWNYNLFLPLQIASILEQVFPTVCKEPPFQSHS